MIRIRFCFETGMSLGYSIERLSDGRYYDFATGEFTTAPRALISPLPEQTSPFVGRYAINLGPTPASQFSDGDYCIAVHALSSNLVVACLGATMRNGDDVTYYTPGPVITITENSQASPRL